MRSVLACVVAAMAAVVIGGCAKVEERPFEFPTEKNYEAPLPPGVQALRKITDPRQIPDFTLACANTTDLRASVENSLNYLAKPTSRKRFPSCGKTHADAVASLKAFLALLDQNLTAAQMNAAIRSQFDVYTSVGCDMRGTVLATCYYTPIFTGSPAQTDKFRWPLYRPPADLVKLEDGSPSKPMADRRTLETTPMLAGTELVWMADPFEAYVAQIQGSVKLRMPDGQLVTYGYTANNGHAYKSVRAELVKDGKIGKRDGLPAMLRYFRAHPGDVTKYTWRNPRYVFFAVIEDGRPRGCLNEPVTTGRTLATDKSIFPAACLALLTTSLPQRRGGEVVTVPFAILALDQDSGGAIRAAGRCDLYLGVGDDAGDLAGRAQNEGRLYYLFLKTAAAPTPPPAAPAAPPAPAAAPAARTTAAGGA